MIVLQLAAVEILYILIVTLLKRETRVIKHVNMSHGVRIIYDALSKRQILK